jgi:hypothetical protein
MARTQLKLKDVVLNTSGQVIEIEVFDMDKREAFKMGRIEDIHGDVKKVEIDLSDGRHLTGEVNLTKYRRVSDLFAYGKQFQPVMNANINGNFKPVYFLNKAFVVGANEIE